jgi:hypothetical protein
MPSKSNCFAPTVDLSGFPDLVVIYPGMKVRSLRGVRPVFSFGPRISSAVAKKPDGLLLHEQMFVSFFPLHVAMRQYWHDFDSLKSWALSVPHQKWWLGLVGDSGETGFWHETYLIRGGMEAIYDAINAPHGFGGFALMRPAEGAMFSARQRLHRKEQNGI